jgi:hypothetical protein
MGDAMQDLEDEEVYRMRRDFQGSRQYNKEKPLDQQQLYLRGLQGMLEEMRRRRPADTPYGHTQQLMVHLNQGSKASKVRDGFRNGF